MLKKATQCIKSQRVYTFEQDDDVYIFRKKYILLKDHKFFIWYCT